ncbi:ATP-binding protein [Rhizobium leguminosarum]|uniref:ATP-binding protein n=1 Tax=Rhizobium leguminosarum TaxID=384 RepID=UPI003F985561
MDQINPVLPGMLLTNLRGQIRQTPLPRWKALLPLFEAIMNSVQAIQESKAERRHRIGIEIHREDGGIFREDTPAITGFSVADTGVGFDDDNFFSFNTAFSEYKYDRGGKGLGRFMWLKAFDHVEIESVFSADDGDGPSLWRRSFRFGFDYNPDQAQPSRVSGPSAGTTVRLSHFRKPYSEECPRDLDQLALRIAEHFILVLMQPDCPEVELQDQGLKLSLNQVYRDHFQSHASEEAFDIAGRLFTIHGFRLTAPRASKHRLIYAANSRGVVTEMLENFVPNLVGRLQDENEKSFAYLAVVQGDYLNEKVNNFRTDFEMTEELEEGELGLMLTEEIRRSDIRNKCIDFVERDLEKLISNINAVKSARLTQYVFSEAPQYKPLLRYIDGFISSVTPNATKIEMELALHSELHKREVALKRESGKILSEAARLKDYDSYRERLADFMERSNELGTSALAQYVMHRKIVLELLAKALSADRKTERYPLEEAVHSIVFPMRGTDRDILYSQQNLWIIDERLNYHSYIASDKPLSSHVEFDSTSKKRPDLFIFDRRIAFAEGEEGQAINSLVVVEFKRPQRDDYTETENPLQQVLDQIRDIRSGQFKNDQGRPIATANDRIPAFAYIICDITPAMKRVLIDRDAKGSPDGLSYYGYHANHAVYYEVIDYGRLLADAKRRNRVFFDKLNLMGGSSQQ